MSPRRTTLAIILGACLPGALAAQPSIVLEAAPGIVEIGACQYTHVISTCSSRHIETMAITAEGTLVVLDDGVQYRVEWSGPGYTLESGIILQPLGETKSGLKGQRWLEVFPEEGRIHTSSVWKDLDADRSLGAADKLVVDGREQAIRDVRLHLRVKAVTGPAAEGQAPGEGHRSPRQQ